MKKIALAACLLFATGPAFTQDGTANNSNDHGQNDCQCMGVGKPLSTPAPSPQYTPQQYPHSIITWDKAAMQPFGLWYLYLKIYLQEVTDATQIKHQ